MLQSPASYIFECLLHFPPFFFLSFFLLPGYRFFFPGTLERGWLQRIVEQPDSTLNEVKKAQGYCSAALDLGLLCSFGSASLQGCLFAPPPPKRGIIPNQRRWIESIIRGFTFLFFDVTTFFHLHPRAPLLSPSLSPPPPFPLSCSPPTPLSGLQTEEMHKFRSISIPVRLTISRQGLAPFRLSSPCFSLPPLSGTILNHLSGAASVGRLIFKPFLNYF